MLLRKTTRTLLLSRIIGGSARRGVQQFATVQNVFDRNVKRMQRDRAASSPDAKLFDYLREEAAQRLLDRLDDTLIKFPVALDLGCASGSVRRNIQDRGGVELLYQCDSSPMMLQRAINEGPSEENIELTPPVVSLVADEELLPFAPNSFDLVLSNLSLHWVNDLPSCCAQILKCLRPNGAFLASFLGGTTLNELRQSLVQAEQEQGGVGVHVSPLLGIADAGNLVSGAGFTLPTADIDTIHVQYEDMYELLHHLQGMGESNCAHRSRHSIRRDVLHRANDIYKEKYPSERGIVATFQVIYTIGWKEHKSQPKPKERGSAQFSLKDLPGTKHGTL